MTGDRAPTPPAPHEAAANRAAAARDEAARHIQEHSLGEAARIGRLSRIREFVLGAQDGLLARSGSSPAWQPPIPPAASSFTGPTYDPWMLPVAPRSRIILVSRVGHGLVSLVFLCCIAAVYLAAWRGSADALAFAALGALSLEGLLVALSGGNCPLGPALRTLGDETPFFELFLSPRAAKAAVPVLAAAAVVGAVLLAARTL